MKNKKLSILIAAWFLLTGAVLCYLSYGLDWLDTRLYYSHWEALGFLSNLDPMAKPKLVAFALIDLLIFIPTYFYLTLELIRPLQTKRLLPLLFLCVLTSADLLETIFGLIALNGKGWESGFVPMVMSLSTPVKWVALLLLTLSFLWIRFVSLKNKTN